MKSLCAILLFLVACGPPASTTPSLLSGYSIPYYQNGSWYATLYFDGTGTFIFNAKDCQTSGTWQDLNPGAPIGNVALINASNTCNATKYVTIGYVIAQGELVLSQEAF